MASAARASLLALVVVGAAACGGTKLGAPRCNAAQLAFTPGGGAWSEKTGQHTTQVLLKNISRITCALDGYPTLRIFGGHGAELAFNYTHDGDQMLSALHPRPVRIAPGGDAVFVFNKYRCDLRDTDFGKTLLMTLPGGAGSRILINNGGPEDLAYCNEAPSLKIDVTPILPSLAGARR